MPAIDFNRAFKIAQEIAEGRRQREEQASRAAIAFKLKYLTQSLLEQQRELENARRQADAVRQQGIYNLLQTKMNNEAEIRKKLLEPPDIDWEETVDESGKPVKVRIVNGEPDWSTKLPMYKKPEEGTDETLLRQIIMQAKKAQAEAVEDAYNRAIKPLEEQISETRKSLKQGAKTKTVTTESGRQIVFKGIQVPLKPAEIDSMEKLLMNLESRIDSLRTKKQEEINRIWQGDFSSGKTGIAPKQEEINRRTIPADQDELLRDIPDLELDF